MLYRLEIQRLLLQIQESAGSAPHCIGLFKQAIQVADKNEDLDWGIDLRVMLIREERSTSKCEESPAAFAWLLTQCEQYPEQLDEAEFFEEYEWMICSAYSNLNFPLAQVYALANDLKERLDKHNFSKRSYYYTMAGLAQHLGDYELSDYYVEQSRTEPLDEICNETMVYDNEIENASRLGKFDEAMQLMQEMEYKKLNDFSLPFETYISMAYFMAKANFSKATIYIAKAKEEFTKLSEINSSLLYGLTRLIYAMHLCKDEDVWSYYEIMADWDQNAEDDLRYMLSRHMAFVFDREGEKKLQLSSKVPFFTSNNTYVLKDIAAYYKAIATDLAFQFDQRNGNSNAQNELKKLEKENQKR